jgi:TonB-dependent SusC/RagA subfamily outer membrane receptor
MAHDIHAQVKPIDKTYVVLVKSEWQLQEIFKNIENITDYKFVYPEDILNNKPINTKKKRQSVNDLLVDIGTAANLKFKQVDNSIYVGEGSGKKEIIQIEIEEVTVSGKVTDDKGESLPGATITVLGTTTGTVTDIDGNYSITVPDGAVLVFSFIGYEPIQIPVDNQSLIDVTLKTDISSLEEIVVVGYGTTRRADLTTSIGSLENVKSTVDRPISSVQDMLQGQIAGVTVVAGSGDPGATPRVIIRGVGTMGNESPLYVVDGMPYYGGRINPNDIESMVVLKDAAAAAIYGAQAASGVIVITTKSGKSGETKVSLDFYRGVQSAYKTPEALNAQEYASSYRSAAPMLEVYLNQPTTRC